MNPFLKGETILTRCLDRLILFFRFAYHVWFFSNEIFHPIILLSTLLNSTFATSKFFLQLCWLGLLNFTTEVWLEVSIPMKSQKVELRGSLKFEEEITEFILIFLLFIFLMMFLAYLWFLSDFPPFFRDAFVSPKHLSISISGTQYVYATYKFLLCLLNQHSLEVVLRIPFDFFSLQAGFFFLTICFFWVCHSFFLFFPSQIHFWNE